MSVTRKPPIVYRRARAWFAAFTCPIAPLERMMPDPELRPVLAWPGAGVLAAAIFDYQDSSIGPYVSATLTVPCRHRHSTAVPLLPLLGERFLDDVGNYVLTLPVTTRVACESAETGWSYPAFVADIHLDIGRDQIACTVSEGGQEVMHIDVSRPGPSTARTFPLRTYSHQGRNLLLSETTVDGRAAVGRMGAHASMRLASHPRNDKLADLPRVYAHPLEVRWFDEYYFNMRPPTVVSSSHQARPSPTRRATPSPSVVRSSSLPPRGRDGFYHPASEEELCELIRAARAHRISARVRGSAHSIPQAIYTDAYRRGQPGEAIEIMLDRFAAIHFDDERKQVTVAGGSRFARDPRDPTGRSSDQNGLCYQLDQRGWALNNLGGVAHQTIAGFLTTGSSGGSRRHDLHQQIASMRVIDGTGRIHELSETQNRDGFLAAGVSMGLLGVVSSVTLNCIDRFDIIGEEITYSLDDCDIDLFGDSERSLERFLLETDYARMLWWPQPGVDKLVVWKARQMKEEDYTWDTGRKGHLVRRPHRAFTPIGGTTLPLQAIAGRSLELVASLPEWMRAPLHNAFVSGDKGSPKRFWDTWWRGLPLDTEMDERLLPTAFTELWIPISRAQEAMRRLRDHYARRGFDATGNFLCEIYAGPQGRFHLSPAQGEDALRFNFFWFGKNRGNAQRDYFPQFWELFSDLGYRLHWGKYLPSEETGGASRIAPLFPRWSDFLRTREEMDPDQIFLTDYWRAHFGIPARAKSTSVPTPSSEEPPPAPPEPNSTPKKLPLWFSLDPSDPSFAEQARFCIDNRELIEAPAHAVYDVLTTLENGQRWIPYFTGAEWLTDDEQGIGGVIEATFQFMTMRARVVACKPKRSRTTSIEACTLPLASQMLEDIDITPTEDGRTRLRWRICYTPLPEVESYHALAHPLLVGFFRKTLAQLAEYMKLRTQALSSIVDR